jgi:hypothetical protein
LYVDEHHVPHFHSLFEKEIEIGRPRLEQMFGYLHDRETSLWRD